MNNASLSTNSAVRPAQEPTIEYAAQLASTQINDEVKMRIGERGLTITTLVDIIEIPFAEMNVLDMTDSSVVVQSDSGNFTFSQMGTLCESFYNALCEGYNALVLRAFFVKDEALATALTVYDYAEGTVSSTGTAMAEVYDECVVILSSDLCARRIPLCFATTFEQSAYGLSIGLDTGEKYNFTQMGYAHDSFISAAAQQIRNLYDQTLATANELDPMLTPIQASQIARLSPRGASVSLASFAVISPSFVAALEERIVKTRIVESFKVFKQFCNPADIWIGFKKNASPRKEANDLLKATSAFMGNEGGENPFASLLGFLGEDVGKRASGQDGILQTLAGGTFEEAPVQSLADPYLFWMIAFSSDGRFAAVEFAGSSDDPSATFVYRVEGNFESFAIQLNRALEAIDFKWEVICLSDDELRNLENIDYFMAAKRTSSLRFIRANFEGQIAHSSLEGWKKSLFEYFGAPHEAADGIQSATGTFVAFCPSCGTENISRTKFCGECGKKLI